jgi:outer membrane immunogenic protein
MKRVALRVVALATLVAGGSASAADLPVKAPVYKAPPVILSDWAGFYVGVNGGGGWAENTFNIATGDNAKLSGGLGGGHVGYNWQFGSFVVGVEGDFDGADISTTTAADSTHEKIDELGTVRGRAGYTFLPRLLAYGTAGYAYGHTELNNALGSYKLDRNGWVAGGGLEYKVWGPLIARVEYLHYDFGSKTSPDFPIPDTTTTSVDVVRGGLSYKF